MPSSYFTQLREDALARVDIKVPDDLNKMFTIEREIAYGKSRRMQHMQLKYVDNFGITFYQQTKAGERQYVFDGDEILSAERE